MVEWGRRVLVTGSAGLIGEEVCRQLSASGVDVRQMDVRGVGAARADVTRVADLEAAILGCDGVIHLAAVARVVAAEQAPAYAVHTNVGGTKAVLAAARAARTRPWVVFASSREVYGDRPEPVTSEDAPLLPSNVYARTKVDGERAVHAAQEAGVRAAVIRLSNVYGGQADHPDRVVPAFVDGALQDQPLRVEGPECAFDFTHVSDAARGLLSAGAALHRGEILPPIQLVTGVSTSLLDLARAVIEQAGSRSPLLMAPPRGLGAVAFVGDPRRAHARLGWRASTDLATGLARLISQKLGKDWHQRSAQGACVDA